MVYVNGMVHYDIEAARSCALEIVHDFKQVGPLDSESKAPRYLMECVRASECACGHKRGRNDEGELLMCTCD